jgi:ABC-type branched-subunit amino acid transport system substrate-binding protein
VIGTNEAELLTLRLRYEAAYDAYRCCVKALAEAGRRPSHQLLVKEASALRALREARERYRGALLQIDFDPPIH